MVAGMEWFEGLLDDAAVFPPGSAPLETAVAEHDRHRASDHAALVGPLVVPDTALNALGPLVAGRADPLDISIVVTGGAGAIEPATIQARRLPQVRVRALECAARDDDLAQAVRRVATMVAQLEAQPDVWVELPQLTEPVPTPGWLDGLDQLAMTGYGFKFRTGGLTPDAFPTGAQLTQVIDGALDRELATKLTAGLHHAVRHRDSDGLEHHGFVNVLNAFDAAREGATAGEVEALLESRDGPALAQRLTGRGADAARRTRRSFVSFGTCSITEPVEDLAELGWTWTKADR